MGSVTYCQHTWASVEPFGTSNYYAPHVAIVSGTSCPSPRKGPSPKNVMQNQLQITPPLEMSSYLRGTLQQVQFSTVQSSMQPKQIKTRSPQAREPSLTTLHTSTDIKTSFPPCMPLYTFASSCDRCCSTFCCCPNSASNPSPIAPHLAFPP